MENKVELPIIAGKEPARLFKKDYLFAHSQRFVSTGIPDFP